MKKMIIVFFCMLVVAMNSFAEFVISPKLGYSNIFTLEPQKIEINTGFSSDNVMMLHKNSWNNFVISADMGFIGKKGFTFLFNNSVSFLGSINKKASFHSSSYDIDVDLKLKKLKGAYWNGELLLGYTFKQPNVYITLAGGLGSGGVWDMIPGKIELKGKTIDTKDMFAIRGFNLGFALHISTAYYFTENIGLAFSLSDTVGYGKIFTIVNKEKAGILSSIINDKSLNGDAGFSNVFCLKIGPVFKF